MPRLTMGILIVLAVVIIAAGIISGYFSYKDSHQPEYQQFASGHLPSSTPAGFYKGSIPGYTGTWQGKKFAADGKTGLNVFTGREADPFNVYAASSLSDRNQQVLRIDYNRADNSLWLRPLVDEVVEVSPGQLLGRINYRVLPGWSVPVGYFRLEQSI